jgi:hypothetical protein
MKTSLKIADHVGHTILEMRAEELRLKRADRNAAAGKNIPNAVADVSVVPDWLPELQRVSPNTGLHSYLMPYWYRAAQRWVLYDVVPVHLIEDDADTGSGISGRDLKAIMNGPRPSEREDFKDLEHWPVSDTQHEMWRLWRGYARPFWILQGDLGGHQYRFSPFQSDALCRMGLPTEPPRPGGLPPAPFDKRVIAQLNDLNRLHLFVDSIDRLRKSGGPEAAEAEAQRREAEIRQAELRFIEAQMRPLVEMSQTMSDDVRYRMPDGMGARAKDAFEQYVETGVYSL